MADRHIALPQSPQMFLREHLMNEAVALQVGENTVIVDDDATRLLPPVLERIEGKVSRMRDVCSLRFEDAEDAAFFM